MSDVERATVTCGVCGASVVELRRGRCWHCYSQWADMRPVGKGATCAICYERRREQLRLVELHGRSTCFCHSCAARTLRLLPLPHAIEDIRAALHRERRDDERRDDRLDQRIFPRERRQSDRRGPERVDVDASAAAPATPESFADALGAFDDVFEEIEIDEADIDIVEQTVVQDRPSAASAEA